MLATASDMPTPIAALVPATAATAGTSAFATAAAIMAPVIMTNLFLLQLDTFMDLCIRQDVILGIFVLNILISLKAKFNSLFA